MGRLIDSARMDVIRQMHRIHISKCYSFDDMFQLVIGF